MKTALIPADAGNRYLDCHWRASPYIPWVSSTEVTLGEQGRGRMRRVVPFTRPLAPEETLASVSLEETKLVGGAMHLALHPQPQDEAGETTTIAIVSAKAPYSRSGSGTIVPLLGAKILAEGRTAAGAAGHIGSAMEALVMMPLGSVVRVLPFGRARPFLAIAIAAGKIAIVTNEHSRDLVAVDAAWQKLDLRKEGSAILEEWWGVPW